MFLLRVFWIYFGLGLGLSLLGTVIILSQSHRCPKSFFFCSSLSIFLLFLPKSRDSNTLFPPCVIWSPLCTRGCEFLWLFFPLRRCWWNKVTLSFFWEWEFGEDENGQQHQATKTRQEMQTVRKHRQKMSSFFFSLSPASFFLKNKEERRESWIETQSVPLLCFPWAFCDCSFPSHRNSSLLSPSANTSWSRWWPSSGE